MKKILISQRRDSIVGRDEVRDALDTRWAKVLFDLGFLPIPVCSELAGEENYIEQLKPDGVLLSGGNDLGQVPERDFLEIRMLDYAKANILPVLCICRGMQVVNSYLGGSVIEVNDHVATRHLLSGEWAKKQGYGWVNSYHNYGIKHKTLASSLKVLATTADGVIEAVTHLTLPWVGIMWHPERDQVVTNSDQKLILNLFGGKSFL